ncbi:hypothetical protein RJ641_010280 [Dillenia turbinata]|uniref:Transducin/WD40 repeat-like superfamily protein n=1 Tax=Dillenia turbinata TaxID=194707 RepID=A0AAN8UY64_9MAGN
MEWNTVHHLDLRHVDRGLKQMQPHAATFHPNQALICVAIGNHVIEFDAFTGCKVASINIGAPVVRMSYSPTSGHAIIAILQIKLKVSLLQQKDCTIRSCDFDTEQTYKEMVPHKVFSSHTQVGSQPITSVAWLPILRLLVTLSRDGSLQIWKTRVMLNPHKPPMQANFFEPAGVEDTLLSDLCASRFNRFNDRGFETIKWPKTRQAPSFEHDSILDVTIEPIDLPRILSQQGGETVYPLPRIKSLVVHPKFNLAALLFANVTGGDNLKNRAAYTREGRKQLFAVLQSARGSSASVLKEKLASLGSSGILADHQLQAQMQEHHMKGQSQLTLADIARKAFLYSHFMEGHAKSAPVSRLPLITISDSKHLLKDIPVCQPFHLELNFFSKENRVVHYPVRAFYIDGLNLMAYNLSSGVENTYKKLYATVPGGVEYYAKCILHSKKQCLFLVVYEFSGATSEVVLYWEKAELQPANNKGSTVKGRDAALIGPNECQFAILEEDKTGLALYILPGGASKDIKSSKEWENAIHDGFSANGEKTAAVENVSADAKPGSIQGPLQFMFETDVDRIFSTPLESTVMFASHGKLIGLAKLIQGYRLSTSDSHDISTKPEGRKSIKLKVNEVVLQVQWQETLRGFVAGILTSQRVLIASSDLDILASISMLGWDGKVRTVLSISMPCAVLVGALNDRLLLASPTEINPRQKKGVEIKSCLVGLLEPLLIGFGTMQQYFEQKIDLSEILYQITSRFDSIRITPRSLDILSRGPPVCGDLAVSLSQAGPHFPQVLRCIYAIRALRFSTALSVLKDEFLRSRDYPQCPPTSHLFHRFRQLGYACIKYGQFDSARETFEVIADYESMLDLFICHLNPSAMRRLAQKLEEIGTDSELRRSCERILRVRSSGWTQGIFANFAAESMVPKGPEWGGGNWEIKTPTNVKAIPQWELAAEVMPYMKTDDGPIPAIITDHIGVYLGSIKGRGNVVDISDGSLVKAFTPANGQVHANDLDKALVKSMSNTSKTASDGGSKGESLMGLEALAKNYTGSSASDEQAKAAEEFKRSLYGTAADGSSSDEEGTSKSKKLHIRIKDKSVASTTVDVDKIKEATKQFKLGDGLGPPMRTRSLSGGSQDLGAILNQPATATGPPAVSGPTDLFGTDALAKPAPLSQPTVTGLGVTAGPIPEDFFQNTIPSLQVASTLALPPPGSILSKLNPSYQGLNPSYQGDGDNKVPTNQAGTPMANIGLPDGGIPPQAPEQPVAPLGSIAVPDGGVSPQSAAQVSVSPQPQTQATPLPMSTQPLDLSVLGVSGSENASKPPAPSPPSTVRPGQVPRGAAASVCFKTGLVHLEQNQLSDALSCFDEAFLALAKDQSRGSDIKAQATICAQYKIAVTLLQEISRLQKVQGANAISAKDEMARLSRHLGSLPLLAKHRINCIRTAIKRNMEVQNYAYAKQMLDLLLSKAPPSKQDELRSLIDMCNQRGLTNKSIDPLEDPSQFCAATLSRLSTIGYDVCDLCGAKFSALSTPGCIICGMGSIKRSDALQVHAPVASPFG